MANGQSLIIEFETVFFIKSEILIYLPAVEFDNIFIHQNFGSAVSKLMFILSRRFYYSDNLFHYLISIAILMMLLAYEFVSVLYNMLSNYNAKPPL